MGKENPKTILIRDILARNGVQIDNGISISDPIEHTAGVHQGDPRSTLLFNIATYDVIQATKAEEVNINLYANDMVLASQSQKSLQATFNHLVE